MSDFATAIALDPVKQFSVFAENRVGRLYDLTSVFKAHEVHIVALTVLDTTDSAILRMIVDDPDLARELLINNDFPFTETSVLATQIEGEHRIKPVLGALLEAEINIHYVYSFLLRPSGKSGLIINAEDHEVAAQALNTSGFRILTQADISR
ncbi:MAG: acetolactate synthase [Candidatus Synoicihabitans palmerolidicus]|nr:acetolactate synthase [Candidatus Synoicihabitans palmerolidicus]